MLKEFVLINILWKPVYSLMNGNFWFDAQETFIIIMLKAVVLINVFVKTRIFFDE